MVDTANKDDINIEITQQKESSNQLLINVSNNDELPAQNNEQIMQQGQEIKQCDSHYSEGSEEEEKDKVDEGEDRLLNDSYDNDIQKNYNQIKEQKAEDERVAIDNKLEITKKSNQKFLDNLRELKDDYDDTGNLGLGECIDKVRRMIKESHKISQDHKEQSDSLLLEAESLITDYMEVAREKGQSQLYFMRSEIYLRMNKFIQALHDYEQGCILDQSVETAKSSFEHYKITQSLMRMSNDV